MDVGAPWGRELGFQVAAEGAWWQHSRVSGGRCYITSPTMAGAPRPQELWDGMREGGGRCRTRGAAERTRALFFFSLFITPALRVWGRARAPVLCGFGEGRVPLCCEGQAAAAARRRRVGQAGAVERAGVAFFFPSCPPVQRI